MLSSDSFSAKCSADSLSQYQSWKNYKEWKHVFQELNHHNKPGEREGCLGLFGDGGSGERLQVGRRRPWEERLENHIKLCSLSVPWVVWAQMLLVNVRFLSHRRKNSETRQGGQESKMRIYLSKNTLSEREWADRWVAALGFFGKPGMWGIQMKGWKMSNTKY